MMYLLSQWGDWIFWIVILLILFFGWPKNASKSGPVRKHEPKTSQAQCCQIKCEGDCHGSC